MEHILGAVEVVSQFHDSISSVFLLGLTMLMVGFTALVSPLMIAFSEISDKTVRMTRTIGLLVGVLLQFTGMMLIFGSLLV